MHLIQLRRRQVLTIESIRLSWFNPAQDLRVILMCKGLTQEETWVSLNRINGFGAISGYVNEPMTYSLEVQYAF